tara:strand:- start:466 stop:633 length:168 start_codon:yes stop_codon:yes gene_type:complete
MDIGQKFGKMENGLIGNKNYEKISSDLGFGFAVVQCWVCGYPINLCNYQRGKERS